MPKMAFFSKRLFIGLAPGSSANHKLKNTALEESINIAAVK
jgi:hypothetical protein